MHLYFFGVCLRPVKGVALILIYLDYIFTNHFKIYYKEKMSALLYGTTFFNIEHIEFIYNLIKINLSTMPITFKRRLCNSKMVNYRNSLNDATKRPLILKFLPVFVKIILICCSTYAELMAISMDSLIFQGHQIQS